MSLQRQWRKLRIKDQFEQRLLKNQLKLKQKKLIKMFLNQKLKNRANFTLKCQKVMWSMKMKILFIMLIKWVMIEAVEEDLHSWEQDSKSWRRQNKKKMILKNFSHQISFFWYLQMQASQFLHLMVTSITSLLLQQLYMLSYRKLRLSISRIEDIRWKLKEWKRKGLQKNLSLQNNKREVLIENLKI